MLRYTRQIAAIAVAGFLASPACAQDQAPDVDEALAGTLEIGATGSCVGSLMGADLVITAAHCVQAAEAMGPLDPALLHFQIRTPDGRSFRRGVTDIATDPAFQHGGTPERSEMARDVALLRLDASIPDVKIESLARPDPAQPYVALLPAAQSVAFVAEPCLVDLQQGGLMVLNCDRTFGSSGSPVFSMINGERRIVGIVSAKGERDGDPVTFAVSPLGVLPDLKWARQDLGMPTSR